LNDHDSYLEKTWGAILSRKKDEIEEVFNSLDIGSQKAVVDHLNKMANEEGWHPEQTRSARIALQVLGERNQ